VFDDIQIFNKSAALGRMEGDEELLAEMISIFLEDYPNQMSAIQDAIDRNHAEDLANAAHSFKGSVGNFGAERTFEAARQLEMLAKQNQADRWDSAWDNLKQEMAILEPTLGAVIQ
jgi:HPt (histidine-containing phosphotransfer) domain-containing protein